ncbi:MAG: Fic family protein [Bacteroidetes bacterium]|nr:Fic family protein [Bacteroidota bacterium]
MKPPYTITPEILNYISSISEKIGEANAYFLDRPSPQLRKQNRIKTIHSSLQIEGNTLSIDQITAIIEEKRVIGPEKDILEVQNAINVYNKLITFNPASGKSFLKAHGMLMNGLVEKPGHYRTRSVGIFQGSNVTHVAPPAKNVHFLMGNLFDYIKKDEDLTLIKSCVFHYEVEFIHPFMDGNGRMGRLWQTVILMNKYPVFEFLPFETLVSNSQHDYYKILASCDQKGESTEFIEFMLHIIDLSLEEILKFNNRSLSELERIQYFISLGTNKFTRKDYMNVFKEISSATASRDLKSGVDLKLFLKIGEKNQTYYRVVGRESPNN